MKMIKALRIFHVLIKTLKASEELQDIRFVKRYSCVPAENPVGGYLAACSVSEMKSAPAFLGADSPADMCSITGVIDLYSPFDAKPREFEEKTAYLTEGILMADKDSLVRSLEVSDIDFNSDMQTLTRKIKVKMEVWVSGEEEL